MKNTFRLLTFILLSSFCNIAMGQTYEYEMELKGFNQISETKFSFDVYLRKSATSDLIGIENFQFQINYNSLILNTGSIVNAFLTVNSTGTGFVGQVGNITSSLFTTDGTNIQFASNSAGNTGAVVTVLDNTPKMVATFMVELSKSGNPHNFGDANPSLKFRTDPSMLYTVLNRCNFTGTSPNYTKNGTFSEQVNNRTLIPDYSTTLNTRQLAGYWFSGTGNWNETARWNNVTTANYQTLPGASNNAIIAGSATVTDARTVNELTIASGAYLVLNKDAHLTTDKVYNDNAGGGGAGTVTVAKWTFEGTGAGLPYLADEGIPVNSGIATIDITGNARLDDFYVAGDPGAIWSIGSRAPQADRFFRTAVYGSWVIELSTTGYINLRLSSEQYIESGGPSSWKVQWSLTGSSWTDVTGGGISLTGDTWSAVNDLILPDNLTNQSKVYLRWLYHTGTSQALSVIDNIKITGDAPPTGILVESSATGTGSLIHNNTGVNATVQRYINRWSTTVEHGWHFLSSPVATQAIRPEFVPATDPIPTYIDFYKWDESHVEQGKTGWWINAKDASFNWNSSFESNFVVGRGYLMAYGPPTDYGNEAHEFIGEINVGEVTFTGLTRTSGSSYPGWHLVGNPFTSAIDWGQGSWTKTNIGAVPQIWNESSASYKVISGEGIIPANNGFMVYTSGSGTLTIPSNARVQSDSSWYKAGEEDQISLVAYDPERMTSQETIIGFNAGATEGFDMEYDAMFISGFAPMFYSASANTLFALNCLTELTDELVIPLGFVKNNSTEFNIKLEKSIEGKVLYLTDLKLNKEYNLSENPAYTFTAAEGDNPNRFLLKFGTVGISDPAATQNRLWFNDNQVFFISQGGATQVEVFDIMGRKLISDKMDGWGLQVFPVNQIPGIYIVKVQSADVVKSIKVSIN